jgi:hypothetical protein
VVCRSPAARIAGSRRGALAILGRILRDRGVITDRQLQEAIQHQVLYGGRLGTALHELGFITEERLVDALARAKGVPAADLRSLQPEALALVPKKLAQRFKVFPVRAKGRTLFLAMVDPSDHAAVAHIGYTLGYIVRPAVVAEFRMVQLLRDHYGVDERWRYTDTRGGAVATPEARDAAAAAERLDRAATRDEVVAAVLALGRCYFRRVVFFIVREPWVLGWDGAGEDMDRARASALRVPLDLPSVFQGVTRNRTMFVGRPGPEETNRAFLEALGKKPGTTAAVFPVAVRGRVVNLLWGDSGATGAARGDLGQLLAFMQKIPRAYLRIVRARVAESRKQAGTEPGAKTEEARSE